MTNFVDIKLLPAGEDVLIDTNIFIYYLSNLSPECKEILRRIARGERLHECTRERVA